MQARDRAAEPCDGYQEVGQDSDSDLVLSESGVHNRFSGGITLSLSGGNRGQTYHNLIPISCSDRLDPFSQLPVTLNRFQERLVHFYLVDCPERNYGLSSRLEPHPFAASFGLALNSPPNFEVVLARSAAYRLGLKKYSTDAEKRKLEAVSRYYRAAAIQMVRTMARGNNANEHRDQLVAAIISLGTLDNRTGTNETAAMHFAAVRRILRSMGGPLKLRSPMLSTIMAHFECLYGTPKASYIWQAKDTTGLLEDLNRFLTRIWNLWNLLDKEDGLNEAVKSEEGVVTGLRDAFTLKPLSGLHEVFARPLQRDVKEVAVKDDMMLSFQITCLLNLCLIILDYAVEEEELREYLDKINESVEAAQLEDMPCNNHMWLIQAHDQSSEHNKRVWQGAGFTFLLKHMPYSLQLQIRDWLLAFVNGESVGERKPFKLNVFHFSYAQ